MKNSTAVVRVLERYPSSQSVFLSVYPLVSIQCQIETQFFSPVMTTNNSTYEDLLSVENEQCENFSFFLSFCIDDLWRVSHPSMYQIFLVRSAFITISFYLCVCVCVFCHDQFHLFFLLHIFGNTPLFIGFLVD